MRILVVTQYFWPENFRINDLVSGFTDRGHEVTVLTGIPNYPVGSFFPGYDFFSNSAEEYEGAKIVRVPLLPRGNGSGIRLAVNYLSYAVSACLLGPFRCKDSYDIIFVFEPSPITVALPALLFRKRRGIPVMFWVQDLWPESLSAAGAVRSKWLLDMVGLLVRFVYRRCDRILITSKSFSESIENHGGHPEKILYFPQTAENSFHLSESNQKISVLESIPKGFWIMFAGNIGAAQDLQTIITAAEKLRGHKDIHWIFVGDGRMRSWAEAEFLRLGLTTNVHFVGRHPLQDMPGFFSKAGALLVTLKKEPIFALTVPAKIQSYLSCGKPIVAALDGEGAAIVGEAGAGFTCPAGDADALATIILKMASLPPVAREQMGRNGRLYYEANFDREMLLDKLLIWMEALAIKD